MQAGLKITLHGGEVANEREVDAMLEFAPERFGHMCVLTEQQRQLLMVRIKTVTTAAFTSCVVFDSSAYDLEHLRLFHTHFPMTLVYCWVYKQSKHPGRTSSVCHDAMSVLCCVDMCIVGVFAEVEDASGTVPHQQRQDRICAHIRGPPFGALLGGAASSLPVHR